jgi:hypothetical protein
MRPAHHLRPRLRTETLLMKPAPGSPACRDSGSLPYKQGDAGTRNPCLAASNRVDTVSWKTSELAVLLSMAASNHVYGVRRGANRRRNRRLGGQIVRAKDRQVCPTSGVRQSCRDGEGSGPLSALGRGCETGPGRRWAPWVVRVLAELARRAAAAR